MTTSGRHKPDLILAAAQDYDWSDLRAFVQSLRATGFSGEVRFFVSGLSRGTLGQLRSAGVEISRPRRIRANVGDRKFEPYALPRTRRSWHLQPLYWHVVRALASLSPDRATAINRWTAALSRVEVARYFWFLDYLSRHPSRYRRVLLTDVRDVVFLSNPFDSAPSDSADFFLEDDKLRINNQLANTTWLVYAYGPRAIVELGECPVSCSGVTVGGAPAIREYLSVMVEHLARLTRQHVGVDQGVHNYVLHKGLVANARLIPNGGPVLTVGAMASDEASRLVADRASTASILHQYDRHPDLAAAIRQQFGRDALAQSPTALAVSPLVAREAL